jgi:hypothetical protein
MASRAQIIRLEQRIEALAAGSLRTRIVVVSPGETKEQALQRQGISGAASGSCIFIRTGVPRSAEWYTGVSR